MGSVSVIIPTYNRAHLISDAITSLLDQDYSNLEIVVVDDGSTDNTGEVVSSFSDRVKYIKQENSGACVARNLGALHSTGDYIVFLDSDDIIFPGMLSKLAFALDENKGYGAAYCGFIEIKVDGETGYCSPLNRRSGDVFVEMCTDYLAIIHSVMIRRESLARVGLFDTSLTMYEDMDLNIRLAANYNFLFVPEHLVAYRLAHSDMSHRKAGLEAQKLAFMDRLKPWQCAGRLNKAQWRAIQRKVFGFKRSEKLLYDASAAFENGDFKAAFPLAAQAVLYRPLYMFDRTWVSIFVKSLVKLHGGR